MLNKWNERFEPLRQIQPAASSGRLLWVSAKFPAGTCSPALTSVLQATLYLIQTIDYHTAQYTLILPITSNLLEKLT